MVTEEAAVGFIRAAGIFVLVMSMLGVLLELLKGSR